jgi:hypothetical protein
MTAWKSCKRIRNQYLCLKYDTDADCADEEVRR